MRCTGNNVIAGLVVLALAVYPALALATAPIRHSSENGQSGGAVNWSLFGPTDFISFPKVNVKMSMQARCPGQDLAASNNDPTNAGGCTSGAYMFLYQIPSGPDNLEVTFKDLVGFTFNDDPSSDGVNATIGVLLCDSTNISALCTNADPTQIPDITLTHNSANTVVTVLISQIPDFPAVTCPAPDPNNPFPCIPGNKGLTLFLTTAQSSPLPIGFPKVKLKTKG